jgi:hypothetical protein
VFNTLVHDEEVQLLHQQGLLMGAGQVALTTCSPQPLHSLTKE